MPGGDGDEAGAEYGTRSDNRTGANGGVVGATAVHTPPMHAQVRRQLLPCVRNRYFDSTLCLSALVTSAHTMHVLTDGRMFSHGKTHHECPNCCQIATTGLRKSARRQMPRKATD